MSTDPRTIKTRAAVAAEVSDDLFSLQEVALDEAKNDIANLNGWVVRVDEKFTNECHRLGQESQTTAERQDGALTSLDGKVRMLEVELRRFDRTPATAKTVGNSRKRVEKDKREDGRVVDSHNLSLQFLYL
ncbi:hypothetical protein OUZ56_016215 [Daphnia magna]|uniref:Uncharacterized protein n=1 Tax=Daphnia magna TaxID=35525 RepID=A0ABR0AQ04_9CRUS|nr:hypothetical protein OUZ56_016215 [Daphnia magna]